MNADERTVELHTRYWIERGVRLFQAHLHGGSEGEQCLWLLNQLQPPLGAKVLDIGSGIGTVADVLTALRPDLDFTLLNISPSQLALSRHTRVQGDMQRLPFADQAFDCALICYALGHGDAPTVLREARRVSRSVLVLDILAEDRAAWQRELHYSLPQLEQLEAFADVEQLRHPDGGRFEPLLPGFWTATGAREFVMRMN